MPFHLRSARLAPPPRGSPQHRSTPSLPPRASVDTTRPAGRGLDDRSADLQPATRTCRPENQPLPFVYRRSGIRLSSAASCDVIATRKRFCISGCEYATQRTRVFFIHESSSSVIRRYVTSGINGNRKCFVSMIFEKLFSPNFICIGSRTAQNSPLFISPEVDNVAVEM